MNAKKKGLTPEDIRRFNWYIWRTVIACFSLFVLLLLVTYLGVFGAAPLVPGTGKPKK